MARVAMAVVMVNNKAMAGITRFSLPTAVVMANNRAMGTAAVMAITMEAILLIK